MHSQSLRLLLLIGLLIVLLQIGKLPLPHLTALVSLTLALSKLVMQEGNKKQ